MDALPAIAADVPFNGLRLGGARDVGPGLAVTRPASVNPASRGEPQQDLASVRHALVRRLPEFVTDLLGEPTLRGRRQWRWGGRGSLSVEMLGAKAGAWYDHEAGQGGGPLELITRQRGGDWRTSADWARRWLGEDITTARDPAAFDRKPANDPGFEHGDQSRRLAAQRARRDWLQAEPARADHQYLARKQVLPHDLRQDRGGRLVIALVDLNGATQTLQTIDATGEKRFLSGGAKSGHFATIGGTLPEGGTILIAEGWATAATAFEATGYPAVAAMDAGNLAPVAIRLRDRYPAARLTILADNDQRDGRPDNPGIAAATAAARAVGALLALPPMPGDMNDMALAFGPKFVQSLIDAAQPPPTVKPTYPRPVLTPIGARLMLQRSVRQFAEDTACYWRETSSLDRHDSG